MKKLLLVIAMVTVGFTANAQGQFGLGANVGLPLGDTGKATKFMFSVETNYLFEVSDEFKVGPSLSYHYYLGKSAEDVLRSTVGDEAADAYKKAKELAEKLGTKIPNTVSENNSVSMLPIAAAARFNATDEFTIGADLGYAVGLEKNSKGYFYYRPLVGYNFGSSMVQLAYSGFEGGGAVTLGVMFGF